jgi:serine phosphatase RsbU (regulator of sigma subunit)
MTMDAATKPQKDVLIEASEILLEPSRDTKRKILISLNFVIGLLFALFAIIQLATVGHLPDPERDNITYPIILFVNWGSLAYNVWALLRAKDGIPRWDTFTKWASVIVLQAVSLIFVHLNPNTATSFLFDQTLSIITIFFSGVVISRGVGAAWFGVTIVSMVVAVSNRGADFLYVLMTRQEVQALFSDTQSAAFNTRMAEATVDKVGPLPITLFALIFFFFALMAFLATFFEASLIGRVLGAIPAAIEKINIAAREKQRLEQENLRMSTELDVARRLQAMVLPRAEELKVVEGLEVVATMSPATEVGGDIYDVVPRADGSTFFVIGDVTDHGLPSGVVMLMSQAALRSCLEATGDDLMVALQRVNTVIFNNVQKRMGDFRNLTLALLHHKAGKIRLSGQHESVLLVRKGAAGTEQIDTMELGFYVGMLEDITPMLAVKEFDLGAGDLMMLYTDGATEAENPQKEQYGLPRLMASLYQARDLPTQQVMDKVMADIRAFMGTAPMLDDIALVLVRRPG